MSTYQSLGEFDGDADTIETKLGESARDTEVVDLCEGSMDNEERQYKEEVGL